MVYSRLFTGSFSKIYMLINGIVTKILPCILFPVLTIFLVFELRRASQNRTEKTTGLVIFAAITFFLMKLPLGIATVLQVAYTDMGYVYIATYIADYYNHNNINQNQFLPGFKKLQELIFAKRPIESESQF
ncbi:hypothetical protein CAEBREN_06898 [Caenorhabditis brenneri]|uniref:Uncharacterized protein n=1 Tax=Caenorhabditis brenneri TaxID=135651 RepID=G0P782_CAEBE|nr:hypothetical protein CAEBREN_06898 [Caenorhabditis brenneri]